MLMTLGQFVFQPDDLTFSEIQRKRSWNYADNAVAAGRKKRQYIGPGDDQVHLPCLIYEDHGFGKRQSIDALSDMADQGIGYVLCDGSGYIYGVYTIDSIDETRQSLMFNGVPRKIDCSISLTRVDDARIQRQTSNNSNQSIKPI